MLTLRILGCGKFATGGPAVVLLWGVHGHIPMKTSPFSTDSYGLYRSNMECMRLGEELESGDSGAATFLPDDDGF